MAGRWYTIGTSIILSEIPSDILHRGIAKFGWLKVCRFHSFKLITHESFPTKVYQTIHSCISMYRTNGQAAEL